MTDKTIAFSLLDLAPIPEGSSAREAFSHSLDLARLAEKRGYHRYWLAEHHNMTGIASAATSVLIGYLAAIILMHTIAYGFSSRADGLKLLR